MVKLYRVQNDRRSFAKLFITEARVSVATNPVHTFRLYGRAFPRQSVLVLICNSLKFTYRDLYLIHVVND